MQGSFTDQDSLYRILVTAPVSCIQCKQREHCTKSSTRTYISYHSRTSVLITKLTRLSDTMTLFTPTCLCGSLVETLGQNNTLPSDYTALNCFPGHLFNFQDPFKKTDLYIQRPFQDAANPDLSAFNTYFFHLRPPFVVVVIVVWGPPPNIAQPLPPSAMFSPSQTRRSKHCALPSPCTEGP